MQRTVSYSQPRDPLELALYAEKILEESYDAIAQIYESALEKIVVFTKYNVQHKTICDRFKFFLEQWRSLKWLMRHLSATGFDELRLLKKFVTLKEVMKLV